MSDPKDQRRPEISEFDAVHLLSPSQRERLAARWITTVVELHSLGATPEGFQGLLELLDVGREELESILEEGKGLLPADVLARLATTKPVEHKTGLLLDEDAQRHFGLGPDGRPLEAGPDDEAGPPPTEPSNES